MDDSRNSSLSEVDPVIAQAIDNEVARQADAVHLATSKRMN